MANDVTCECGRSGLNSRTLEIHMNSNAHKEWAGMQSGDPGLLPEDLQMPIDAVDENPVMRVKMVRKAFAKRGWPDSQRPQSVRDFCLQYGIPVIDVPRQMTESEGKAYVAGRVKELMNG